MNDRNTGGARSANERGIPTTYRGIHYRSRTEARWAVFFELMGWPAEYEPLDLDGYIPDFILAFRHAPLLIEVKSESYVEDLEQAAGKIERSGWTNDALIVGATPFLGTADPYGGGPWGSKAFGYLSDSWTGISTEGSNEIGFAWGEAVPTICTLCGMHGVCSDVHSYENRMCGHYEGDTYRGEWPERELRAVWAEAINAVQWAARGRTA